MGSIVSNKPISFKTFHNVIDGQLKDAQTSYTGYNPITEDRLWETPIATKQDLDDSVVAANRAFSSWKRTTWAERSHLLTDYAEKIAYYAAEIVDLLFLETGKPRFLAEGEVEIAKETILHFASLEQPKGPVVVNETSSKVVKTVFEPIGVVGAICPWNFPVALPMNKLGPGLQAGNCVIMKPSPYAPYTLLKLAEIAQEIFPPGVVQCLGGLNEGEDLGSWMTQHPNIHKISFTGSIPTGKKIMAACAATMKRVTLELGGNDACIVCPDISDIGAVAKEIVLGAFLNTGATCVASKRVYIHKDIYAPMLDAFREQVNQLSVGGANALIGPVQNKMQYQRVRDLVQEARADNYEIVAEGQISLEAEQKKKGYFIAPIIVSNAPSDSRLVREEQFGPILPVIPWTTESEVIHWANDTKTGLSASIWSRDMAQARRIGNELDVGSVYINSIQKPSFEGIFGGHKESGIGVEFGEQGLLQYCNVKSTYIHFDLP